MRLTVTLAILAGLLSAAGAAAKEAPAGVSADDILERNFAALGGKAKLRAVRTLRFEATQQGGGNSVPMKVYWKRPDRLRIESPEEGLEKVQAFDGERAWSTYPQLQGFAAELLDDAGRDSMRDQADLVEGPTFDYAAKGNQVELLGNEKLAEGDAWRLQLTTARGEVRTLWIDCLTLLQVREVRTQYSGGREVTTDSRLSDFRSVGGILFAHRVESRVRVAGSGGQESASEDSVFSIQKIELDVDLPDSLFEMPLPSPPPPPQAAAPAPL